MNDTNSNESASISQQDAVGLLLNQDSADTSDNTPNEEEVIASTEDQVDQPIEESADAQESIEAESTEEENIEEEIDNTQEEVEVVNIDGTEWTMDDLRGGVLRQSDYTKKTQDLAEQRRKLDTANQEILEQRNRYEQGLAEITKRLQEATADDTDWQALKETDPVAYAVKREEYREKQEVLQRAQAEQMQIAQGKMQQHLAVEQEKLLQAIPEWQDPKVAQKEKTEVVTYAKRFGFSDQELQNASDHRAINVLRKAMLYDQLTGNKAVKKKVTKAPKMVKSGRPVTKTEVTQRREQELLNKLNKSGNREDAINYMLAKNRS